MQFLQYVDPIIKWVPTLLFLLIVLTSTFVGFCRGYRKSLIFFIHSLIIGGIFITLFFLFKESKMVDELLLTLVNLIMGSDTALQDLLEVSHSAKSIREVLVLYIPTQLNFMDGLSLILADNGAYLLTLVDLVFSIVFALLFYILYLVFELIMTIIYFIFYSDRKYKKKAHKLVMKGKTEFGYAKRRLKGSLIGFTRGLISGFIMLSLLGSLFFIVSGGRGNEKSPQYDLGNEDYNNIYNAYASISEYGSHGIFKILNAFKDKENVPYYLFAADIIFSGDLKLDEDYSYNIIFREEFATYVDFSKDVLNLMMKYGADDIRAIVNGDEDIDLADAVIKIMVKKEFQLEFEQLIYDFDSKVYISNFALSFVDSLISHIDDTDFGADLDDETKDLLCILFKKGYLSETIPYEYNLKYNLKQSESVDLGFISSKDLINKDNVIIAYRIITDILYFNNVVEDDPDDALYFEMMNNTIDNIAQLSLLYPDDEEAMNKVYRRLYAYVRYNFLDKVDDSEEVTPINMETSMNEYYIDKEFDSIDWVTELRALISVAKDGIYLYQHNELKLDEPEELISQLFEIFNSTDQSNVELVSRLDKVLNFISSSKLMANVLSSNMINGTISDTIGDMFEGYLMPEIKYSNTYDESGHVVSYGEAYYFIKTLSEMLRNPENKLIFDLLYGNVEAKDETDMLLQICNILTADNNKQTIDYLVGSKIFRSIFTAVLEQIETEQGKMIYFDNSVLDIDSNGAKVITKEELENVIYLLPDLLDLVTPLLGKEVSNSDIAALLENEKVDQMLESRLIEGTVTNVLVLSLKENKDLILPRYLANKEKGLVSNEEGISEVKSLINITDELFNESTGVGLEDLLSGDINKVVDVLTKAKDIKVLFESGILYYTVSNYMLNNANNELLSFKIIIPSSCRIELSSDTVPVIIEKNVLVDFFEIGKVLFTDSNTNDENASNEIIKKLIINNSKSDHKYLSNYILSASVMTFMIENNNVAFKDFVNIPAVMVEYITKIETETDKTSSYYYDVDNIVHTEAVKLCTVFDELFEISVSRDQGKDVDIINGDNKKVVTDAIEKILDDPTISSQVVSGKTKFDVVYDSVLIASTLSNRFEGYLIPKDKDALIAENVLHCYEIYDSEFEKFEKEEIFKFITAMQSLGLTDPENIGFKDSIKLLNAKNKEKVYSSILAVGLVTHMIDEALADENSKLRTTPLAYQEEFYKDGRKIALYKECEIDAFMDLLGDNLSEIIDNPKNFKLKSYNLMDVRDIIFELSPNSNKYNQEITSVKSYMIIATVTKEIEELDDIYIPLSAYDSTNKVIVAEEFLKLIHSMDAAGFDFSLKFDNKNTGFMSNINVIAESKVLLATISKKIKIEVEDQTFATVVLDDDSYRVVENDFKGNKIYYLSSDEFINFFHAIETVISDSSFSIEMDANIVKTIAKKDVAIRNNILKSSLMYSVLSDIIEENFEALGLTLEEVSLADIANNNTITDNQIALAKFNEILDILKNTGR